MNKIFFTLLFFGAWYHCQAQKIYVSKDRYGRIISQERHARSCECNPCNPVRQLNYSFTRRNNNSDFWQGYNSNILEEERVLWESNTYYVPPSNNFWWSNRVTQRNRPLTTGQTIQLIGTSLVFLGAIADDVQGNRQRQLYQNQRRILRCR